MAVIEQPTKERTDQDYELVHIVLDHEEKEPPYVAVCGTILPIDAQPINIEPDCVVCITMVEHWGGLA